MSINSVTNSNQYTAPQSVKTKAASQSKTSAAAAKSVDSAKNNTQPSNSVTYNDTNGRLSSMSNLGQYEDLIGRFLSGESEMESANKPLTDDQIALRGFMREYMRTDTRSMSKIALDMKQASKNFMDYWVSSGNKGPAPGRMLSADGSFKIFNSKDEKDEFMKNQKMDFLKNVMSVIKAGKNNGSANKINNLDMKI